MNIIRTKKDNIIKSINFGENKIELVKHVLWMQNVSLFPEHKKKVLVSAIPVSFTYTLVWSFHFV